MPTPPRRTSIRFRDGTSPNKSFLAALQDAKAVDDTHLEITLTQVRPGACSTT